MKTRSAAIYARISFDPDGISDSPEDQDDGVRPRRSGSGTRSLKATCTSTVPSVRTRTSIDRRCPQCSTPSRLASTQR